MIYILTYNAFINMQIKNPNQAKLATLRNLKKSKMTSKKQNFDIFNPQLKKRTKNVILMSIVFWTIAFQIYREILKKYRKGQLLCKNAIFRKKTRKSFFRYSHMECYAKIWRFYVGQRGCNRKHTHTYTYFWT